MSKLIAILGPTNTGKTYLAVERMLRHATGMIGFPLRLLARENYDRLSKQLGPGKVALITGEERILPHKPSYWICTVEAMPLDKEVDYIAIDEVQLAADPERGHAFTARLLSARGRAETVFVGALTMQPLLQQMFPDIEVISRPRFSKLTYSGYRKLTKLPDKSAIIAFSADDVYRMAELVRARHGGAAVVMGALSPRTRNAQVGLFQSGEVKTIVATDAIGMGLNMNIEHIAFARLSKFDGTRVRGLRPDEVGQIAGRAGRHTADGTFGGTEVVEAMDEDLIEQVENHRFTPVTQLMWRNDDLDFASPEALLRSLEDKPPLPFLRRPHTLEDARALESLLQDASIFGRASKPAELFTLWEICQIPDFEKILSESYLRFLKQAYLHLTSHHGVLPEDWVAEQVGRIDSTEGEIDTLTTRLGRIRTWTYIANRGGWLGDSAHWQQKTRSIEDRLSDALHEKLTERFVERRAGIGGRGKLFCHVTDDNAVMIDGTRVGWFNGFHFNPDHEAKTALEAREVLRTIRPALVHAASQRAKELCTAAEGAITLNSKGELVWGRAVVGRLAKGPALLRPIAVAVEEEWLQGSERQQVEARLREVVTTWFAQHLGALLQLPKLELSGPARGVMFQFIEALGSLQRDDVAPLIDGFTKEDRIALGQHGVHLGSHLIWIDRLWTPEAMRARAMLWALWQGAPQPPPPQGKTIPVGDLPKAAWHALGYAVLANRAVRADVLEEFIPLLHQSPAPPAENLARNLGLPENAMPQVLKALGYVTRTRALKTGESVMIYAKRHGPKAAAPQAPADPAAFLRGAWGS
jgi:ATP-dependent RNA helicase SUPV3L1/SUV3